MAEAEAESNDEGGKNDAACFRVRSDSLLIWKVVQRVLVLAEPSCNESGDVVQAG